MYTNFVWSKCIPTSRGGKEPRLYSLIIRVRSRSLWVATRGPRSLKSLSSMAMATAQSKVREHHGGMVRLQQKAQLRFHDVIVCRCCTSTVYSLPSPSFQPRIWFCENNWREHVTAGSPTSPDLACPEISGTQLPIPLRPWESGL